MRRWAPLLMLMLVGCDAPPKNQPASDENFPTIDVSVGQKIVRLPFEEVECTTDGHTTAKLFLRTRGDTRKIGLLARFTEDAVEDAHVWVPKGVLGHAEELPWVQIVAADVDGIDKPECRIEFKEDKHTLVCNNATMVPWTEPGPAPSPSFKVAFRCP